MVEVFGEPGKGSADGKTDVNWKIEFDNGEVANIYNWKNGIRYGNTNIESINEWNIGGYKSSVVKLIEELI